MIKKNMASSILTAALVISICSQATAGNSAKPGLMKRLFGTLSWEETIQTVETPRDAVYAVTQHIKYRADIGDQLTKPADAWAQGYGDCEDIAHAIVALCENKGFKAWVEVFYSPESFIAHAVAIGELDGQLWVSNGRMIKVKDMTEARKVVASTMRWKAEQVRSKSWAEMNPAYVLAASANR